MTESERAFEERYLGNKDDDYLYEVLKEVWLAACEWQRKRDAEIAREWGAKWDKDGRPTMGRYLVLLAKAIEDGE